MVSEQSQSRRDTMLGTTPQTGGASRTGTEGTGGVQGGARGSSQTQTDMAAKAQDVVEQTQEKAGQAVDMAKEQATSQLASQKDRAVDSLGSVAQAFRQTSQHLRQSDQHGIAQYADKAADRVEQFTGQLRGKDVQEIVRDVERYARRQPALFLGGAFVLGLLGARFLKSTAHREEEGAGEDYEYRPGYSSRGSGYRTGGYGYGGQYGGQYRGSSSGNYGGQYAGGTTSGRYTGGTPGYAGGTTSGQYGDQYGSGTAAERSGGSGTADRSWSVRGTETR